VKTVTEDKIIASLAVLGLATILTALVACTIKWVDPFFSLGAGGHTTILGAMFVYGIYLFEAFAGIIVLYLAWLAVWGFIPKRKTKAC